MHSPAISLSCVVSAALRCWSALLLSVSAALLCIFVLTGCKSKELPRLGRAPVMAFTDSNGKELAISYPQPQHTILNFFFVDCQGICPLINENIAAVVRASAGRGELRFVAVSVDPEHDTVARLAEYRKRFDALTRSDSRWHFTRVDRPALQRIMVDGLHLGMPEDTNLHTTRALLIDRDGEIRGMYQATLAEDIEQLQRDLGALR